MTPELWVAAVVGIVSGLGVGGAIATVVAAKIHAGAQERATEQARAEAQGADWQAYTDDLQTEVTALRGRVDTQDRRIADLWEQRARDAEKRATALAHIGALELHIIRGDAPPPPERPANLT